MTRLEGKKPNTGAIIIAAIIFALVAAGLFFAFRPVPEPTDAGLNNSVDATGATANSAMAPAPNGGEAGAGGESAILTPLPEATPLPAPLDNAATPPVAADGGMANNEGSMSLDTKLTPVPETP